MQLFQDLLLTHCLWACPHISDFWVWMISFIFGFARCHRIHCYCCLAWLQQKDTPPRSIKDVIFIIPNGSISDFWSPEKQYWKSSLPLQGRPLLELKVLLYREKLDLQFQNYIHFRFFGLLLWFLLCKILILLIGMHIPLQKCDKALSSYSNITFKEFHP